MNIDLAADLRTISQTISDSYPQGLDPEAHMWRRCMKVTEEAGEVFEALSGYLGENPRKGQTHTMIDVQHELLDVAGAALAAICHLHGNNPGFDPVLMLAQHMQVTRARLVLATREVTE